MTPDLSKDSNIILFPDHQIRHQAMCKVGSQLVIAGAHFIFLRGLYW